MEWEHVLLLIRWSAWVLTFIILPIVVWMIRELFSQKKQGDDFRTALAIMQTEIKERSLHRAEMIELIKEHNKFVQEQASEIKARITDIEHYLRNGKVRTSP